MIRRNRLVIPLTAEDRLEITIDKERGTVKGFVINYVAMSRTPLDLDTYGP